MTRPVPLPRPATISALVMLALAAVFAASCLSSAPKKPAPAPTRAPAPKVKPDPCAGIAAEQKRLEENLASLNAEKRALEDRVASLRLQVLEKETQLKEINEHQVTLQAKLDEAINEVVRAKSKLRSLESRAEAASNMAEAEIALKATEAQVGDGGNDRELTQARQLLKMSADEFGKENYGGALYLAIQAKSHLKTGQVRPAVHEKLPPLPGESPFAVPLPLNLTKTSNLREGPGLEFRVVATLPTGTKLIGLSRKDQWVRVRDEKGVAGWVFKALVSAR
jgi:hypothetical protein